MKQKKTSEMVELNEDELAGVSGGDGSNNGLLYGVGGAAVGAGAMAMLKKPKAIVQTVEKPVYLPANQDLIEKAGEVKKATPVLKKATSFRI